MIITYVSFFHKFHEMSERLSGRQGPLEGGQEYHDDKGSCDKSDGTDDGRTLEKKDTSDGDENRRCKTDELYRGHRVITFNTVIVVEALTDGVDDAPGLVSVVGEVGESFTVSTRRNRLVESCGKWSRDPYCDGDTVRILSTL